MQNKILLILLVMFFTIDGNCVAQINTNLDVVNDLIDSSAVQISKTNNMISKGIYLKNLLPQNYSVLNNQIISAFKKCGFEVTGKPENSYTEINYSIVSVKVNYSDLYKDGFLGDYKLSRTVALEVNYSVEGSSSELAAEKFKLSSTDTIYYDLINQMESADLSFTRGERPDEPMFSSLLEPAIAVCTAAVIIYLFFAVRTK